MKTTKKTVSGWVPVEVTMTFETEREFQAFVNVVKMPVTVAEAMENRVGKQNFDSQKVVEVLVNVANAIGY